MRVPGLIAAKVDLNQIHARLYQAASHQQRPAERVLSVLLLKLRVGIRHIECVLDLRIAQQRNGPFAIAIKAANARVPVKKLTLRLQFAKQADSTRKRVLCHSVRQREIRSLKNSIVLVPSFLMVELKLRERSVRRVVKRRGLNEPRVTMRSHRAGKLPGQNSPRIMDELFRQHGRWRKIVAGTRHVAGNRCDRWVVGRLRLAATEAERRVGPTGQHDVMTQRMVVRLVSQRPADCPAVASLSQHRQVLTDVDAGRLSGDRSKLTTNRVGGLWLQIEALVLSQTSGQKDIDTGSRFAAARTHRGIGTSLSANRVDVIHAQPEQAD